MQTDCGYNNNMRGSTVNQEYKPSISADCEHHNESIKTTFFQRGLRQN